MTTITYMGMAVHMAAADDVVGGDLFRFFFQ